MIMRLWTESCRQGRPFYYIQFNENPTLAAGFFLFLFSSAPSFPGTSFSALFHFPLRHFIFPGTNVLVLSPAPFSFASLYFSWDKCIGPQPCSVFVRPQPEMRTISLRNLRRICAEFIFVLKNKLNFSRIYPWCV